MRKSKKKIVRDRFVEIRHQKSDNDVGRGATAGVSYHLESDIIKEVIAPDIETNDVKGMAYWWDEGPKNRLVMTQVNSNDKIESLRGTKYSPDLIELLEPTRYIKNIDEAAREAFPAFDFNNEWFKEMIHPSNSDTICLSTYTPKEAPSFDYSDWEYLQPEEYKRDIIGTFSRMPISGDVIDIQRQYRVVQPNNASFIKAIKEIINITGGK